jgi:signal transduction histidine kinase
MIENGAIEPRPGQSLSARLLLLTVGFVMFAQVLIYLPSAVNFRMTYLESRLDAAHLAALVAMAAPPGNMSPDLQTKLLGHADAESIIFTRIQRQQVRLGTKSEQIIAELFDLRDVSYLQLIKDTMGSLVCFGHRHVRVIGQPPQDPLVTIDMVMDEWPLCVTMQSFTGRILTLSVILSLITAGLVITSLHWLMVRPVRRLTASMVSFRDAPESAESEMRPTQRGDEIGIAERELADMQRNLRLALVQKTRLAALGEAVAKINHDLRNILATAQLVSDRLAASDNPEVKLLAPRLVNSIDQAITLCSRTIAFGRAEELPLSRERFGLRDLVEEVGVAAGLSADSKVRWQNEVDKDLCLKADRGQVFRVLLNLGRNSAQALGDEGLITIQAVRQGDRTLIDVSDNGPGLPEAARAHIFEPFRGSARKGGSGLGLAIAKELMLAHGGDIVLLRTGPDGATFRLIFPDILGRHPS